jgi:prephenate dehydratase
VRTVAYFGPPGTFTEEALLTQEDLAACARTAQRSVPDVISTVESGEYDVGLVPIENMIEGSVSVTLDTLAFDSELLIQREVDLPVSLNLCAKPGVTLAAVKTVVSFPHAIAQCRGWLAHKLPAVDTRASYSTAEAASEIAKSKRMDQAAICNKLAAEMYGLDVLATEIEDHPENQTRFVVVGRGVPAPTGHDKTTIVCFQREDKPGSLLAILQEFAARAINLTKLESRPTKRGLGDYCFFIDIEGHVADELVADALRNLAAKQAEVKFLGSYPVGGPVEAGVERRRAHGRAWKHATTWVEQLRAQIRQGEDGE